MSERGEVPVLIVSGACCSPVLGQADEQAKAAVARIAAEERIEVETHVVGITAVLLGGVPVKIVERSRDAFERAGWALPAVIVGGEPACFGQLDEARIRELLVHARGGERGPRVSP